MFVYRVTVYNVPKKIIPAPNTRREYPFFVIFVLNLYQRLSKTISKSTGQNGNQVNNGADTAQAIGAQMQHTAACLTHIHSMQTANAEKCDDAQNQRHNLFLAGSAHNTAIDVRIYIGVAALIGVRNIDGRYSGGGLFGLVQHVA